MTWETFCQLFLEHHFPSVIRDRKNLEFIKLIQGSMTVFEYEVKFTALSRFASDMVKDEEQSCRQFEGGLNFSIRPYVVAQGHTEYRKCVDSALHMEGEKGDATQITERNKQLRIGVASTSTQTGARRTRDDAVSSEGTQQSGAPQSSVTVLAPQIFGQRRDLICYRCGRAGHTQVTCQYASSTGSRDTLVGELTCYHCGQQGHVRRMCLQL